MPSEPPAASRQPPAVTGVILAGGRGSRLLPYTAILPKPLMPIGDRSILEIVIDQLAAQRFKDVTLCVGHLSHLIRSVLDHRLDEAVALDYVQEEKALGTAGPLRLIEKSDRTLIVMNGDVLTTIDYRGLVRRHRESGDQVSVQLAHVGSNPDVARPKRTVCREESPGS